MNRKEIQMNDITGDSTEILGNRIQHCDELEALQEILSNLPSESLAWKKKINGIIKNNGYSKTAFASLCGVSRSTVNKWCDGSVPSGRDDFIKIGFAAQYSLNEMNTFLQRYGRYPALYVKSLEDSVFIFVLHSEVLPHTYACSEEIIGRIKKIMQDGQTGIPEYCGTVELNRELLRLDSVDRLTEFVQKNAVVYKSAYEKLYAYINAFIEMNNIDFVTHKPYSVDFLAESQQWSASLRRCVSEIRQQKWFPMRRKVIALGLHLNMTTEQIDKMLALAQMEKLCAKNLVEAAIIYAVVDADMNGLICRDGGTELRDYVRGVLEQLNIQDAGKLLNDI